MFFEFPSVRPDAIDLPKTVFKPKVDEKQAEGGERSS
jgi:hypothetical protein